MSSATRNRKHKYALPLSLLELTLQQARTLSTGTARTTIKTKINCKSKRETSPFFGIARRAHGHAHAHALAASKAPPDPDVRVREGYLRPLPAEGRDGLERRRPIGIAKDIRRPENGMDRHPPYAAVLLNDRVEELVKRTGGELYAPETQEEGLVAAEELYYTETELRDLYTDLLAHPQYALEAQSHFQAKTKKLEEKEKMEKEMEERKERMNVLEGVKKRFVAESESESQEEVEVEAVEHGERISLLKKLASRRKTSLAEETEAQEEDKVKKDLLGTFQERLDSDKLHHNILLRILDVVRGVEDAQKLVGGSSNAKEALVSVLSEPEWNALVRTCIDENEMDVAENSLLLMRRCGAEPNEELVSDVLNVHAVQGDVPAVMSFFEKLAISKPSERQRDLHIKAHLKSPSSSSFGIPSALQVLHNYESLALLPPVKSYARLIVALFSQRSSQYQAQAWDLFAHMRYVAHAKPDAALYALMIRACAGTGYSQTGYSSDPVRALDLWTEMTTEAGYSPTAGAYNAVIRACARSRDYVGEAFRLAKEMLDGHRDAYGYPLMHATRETFDALLIAAKTRKDLSRARWILAEMLKIYEQAVREGADTNVQPDGRIVMHVFHAYASYKPPFKRGDTAIVDENELKAAQGETNGNSLPAPGKEIEKPFPRARFSVTPPQTRQEVLAEADTLFERILTETELHPSSPAFDQGQDDAADTSESHPGPFSGVHLTPAVLNSYLSVHYRHDSLENSRKLYDEIFQRTGVERTARTYVEVLERCTWAEKRKRSFAKAFAEDVWREWLEMEKQLNIQSADSRMIERAYAAMIRMYALVGDLDSALSLLNTFATQYPPHAISHPSTAKPELLSTRTVLYAQRPLIRLTTPTEIQDDTVPPLLTFQDLELLHHRLVAAGPEREKDLDRLTYLTYSYLGALRKRRDRTIQA